jgi:predicted RNase H-like nuclease (RuvC/YqgF family)
MTDKAGTETLKERRVRIAMEGLRAELATEKAKVAQLIRKREEDEASVCPEDYGFVEYIPILEKQRAKLTDSLIDEKAKVAQLEDQVRRLKDARADDLNKCLRIVDEHDGFYTRIEEILFATATEPKEEKAV